MEAPDHFPLEGEQPRFFAENQLLQDETGDILAHQIPYLKVSAVTKTALFWNRLPNLPCNGSLAGSIATKSSVGLTGLAVAKERSHSGYLRDNELPIFLSAMTRQLDWGPHVIGKIEAMEVAEANLDPNRILSLYINVEDLGLVQIIGHAETPLCCNCTLTPLHPALKGTLAKFFEGASIKAR